MTTITKKQASIALVIVALSAIMIAGTIVSSADNAFAHRHHHHHHHHHFFFSHHHHHGKHSSIHQSIHQGCNQHQHSTVLTAGANSPISTSGNNAALCANLNGGGNAAANNQ